jgi:hypothetical protein
MDGYAKLRYAMLRSASLGYATLRYATLRFAMSSWQNPSGCGSGFLAAGKAADSVCAGCRVKVDDVCAGG